MRLALLALILLACRANAQQDSDSSFRSPAIAGVTSFFLPGLGNFYAGDGRHAAIQGGAMASAIAVQLLAMRGADGCGSGCRGYFSFVGVSAFIVRLAIHGWSARSAIDDAHAQNERARRFQVERAATDSAPINP